MLVIKYNRVCVCVCVCVLTQCTALLLRGLVESG